MRKQKVESGFFGDFLWNLKKLAYKDWNFRDKEDSLVRDKFIANTTDQEI